MSSPHRVLFVEDYPPFKRAFERLLTRKFGLDVTVADSGEEAIGQFGAVRPELVILDLGLPGVAGNETLQVIRALPEGESVPVIVLTGSNDEDSRQTMAQLDVDGYVLKENATDEFTDLMLSVFPDLATPVSKRVTRDATEDNGQAGRDQRTVRVLLPPEPIKEDSDHAGWAHPLVRQAFVMLPRLFRGAPE